MNEPLIRVVKKAELGSRETFILRLEAILLIKQLLPELSEAGWPSRRR